MNYDKLAQRIVAQGVGRYDAIAKNLLWPPGASQYVPGAKAFCNDGRVVLALMEKVCEWGGFNRICQNTTEDFLCTAYRGYGNRRKIEYAVADSLREAIVDACLEALDQ